MISGEQFQALAELSLCSSYNGIINNQNRKGNLKLISETSNEEIKKYKTIFVYTHDLPFFFEKFYKDLNGATLISHNSDHGIDASFLPLLEGSNIKKWYCQNRLVSHPKLFSLPIGIANSQWNHGNIKTLLHIRSFNADKTGLVFKNFFIGNNSGPRVTCNQITHRNGIVMSHKTSIEEYWKNLSIHTFAISPVGNGIDCHRIWECLSLRTIPVVVYHEAFSQFKHLPICFVDEWEDVTIEFLHKEKQKASTVDWTQVNTYLQTEYWNKLINE